MQVRALSGIPKEEIVMSDLFDVVKSASSRVDDNRTHFSVLSAIMAEVGELAEEVAIDQGKSYKQPGKDGVIGEAVDVIVATLDMIHVHDPSITEEEIVAIVVAKCRKWMDNSRK